MKIGDRVRLLMDNYDELIKGDEGVIVDFFKGVSPWPYIVKFDKQTHDVPCSSDEIEIGMGDIKIGE